MNTNREEYLHYFEARFSEWVRSALLEPRRGELPGEVRRELAAEPFYGDVRAKLGDEILNWLGWALKAGLIVEEAHRFRVLGGQTGPFRWFSRRDWKEYPLDPNWEAYVHLAYFARLWHPCREAGMRLGFEDRGMDITASRADELVWYVEVKRKQELADRLVRDLTRLSSEPVPTGAIDRNDPLRDAKAKVKYLADYRPSYFSAVAPGTERHFEIEYLHGVGFRLRDSASPVHLLAHPPDDTD